jgi:hypothetical protein
VADLDSAEADWLSRRVRGDDGAPLASAFGLHVERRLEGAAFVVPDDAFRYLHELGATPFPAPGTVPHAALLLSEYANTIGIAGSSSVGPGTGWRGLSEVEVEAHVSALCRERASGPGGWRRELAETPALLIAEIFRLLHTLGLLRRHSDATGAWQWWFSPAMSRWSPQASECDES